MSVLRNFGHIFSRSNLSAVPQTNQLDKIIKRDGASTKLKDWCKPNAKSKEPKEEECVKQKVLETTSYKDEKIKEECNPSKLFNPPKSNRTPKSLTDPCNPKINECVDPCPKSDPCKKDDDPCKKDPCEQPDPCKEIKQDPCAQPPPLEELCKPDPCKKEKPLRAPECFFKDKVALITGGCSGIGLACVKEMFRCGIAGVTVADIDTCRGEQTCKEIATEFGNDKAIFVKCDVMKSELIDWAFKNTIRKFNRLDIVINNAGVLNDKKWENQISINLGGVVIGSLLGLQYMSKSCCGNGGTVINVASILGINPLSGCPIHCMTQCGIIGFTRSLGYGNHFDRTGVRVMALCPGPTNTKLLEKAVENCLNEKFGCELEKELEIMAIQEPPVVARGLVKMLCEGSNGSIWVTENCQPAYEVEFPDLDEMS